MNETEGQFSLIGGFLVVGPTSAQFRGADLLGCKT